MSIKKRLLLVSAALGAGSGMLASAEAAEPGRQATCMGRLSQAGGEAAPLARRLAEAGCEIQYTRSVVKPRKKRRGKGDCFLTGACCELGGLDDDCFELRTLRRFRDETLARMPGGREEIALYYEVGPRIAQALARPGGERDLARVYAGTILPCVALILVGAHEAARARYVRMVRGLMDRHGVAVAA